MTATIGTTLFTLLQGRHIGTDQFGNRYFEARWDKQGALKKRWVMYNGRPEPTKVPPHWHGWLHYTLDAPLPETASSYSWVKPHLPNLTGTVNRYLPPSLKGAPRAKATADYQAWKPE